MRVTTESLDNRQLRLIIEVDEERTQQAMRRAARQIARQVNIPGFRKGKAPYEVIVQRYGEDTVRQEAAEVLVGEVYREVVEQEEIKAYAPGMLEEVEEVEEIEEFEEIKEIEAIEELPPLVMLEHEPEFEEGMVNECPECGAYMTGTEEVCIECGAVSYIEEVDVCIDCGAPVSIEDEVCPGCGVELMAEEEAFECPECGEETEVYSRVVGYLRPVATWNDGKKQEFRERTPFSSEI